MVLYPPLVEELGEALKKLFVVSNGTPGDFERNRIHHYCSDVLSACLRINQSIRTAVRRDARGPDEVAGCFLGGRWGDPTSEFDKGPFLRVHANMGNNFWTFDKSPALKQTPEQCRPNRAT
jgi:hypothetical protein